MSPASRPARGAREHAARDHAARHGRSAPAPHPLESSDELAEQATAVVGLLERFGDLVIVALEAVGSGDDSALRAALDERERLLFQLEPLLAKLAEVREAMTDARIGGPNARAALAAILKPVNESLRHAQLLHLRLTDEVPDLPAGHARRAPLALVP